MKFFKLVKGGEELLIELSGDSVNLLINEGVNRSVINLSINEVRALRDSLKLLISKVDGELIDSLNSSVVKEEPVSAGGFFNHEASSEPEPVKKDFKLFSDEPVKDKTEFYY